MLSEPTEPFRAFWTHSEHFGRIQSILDALEPTEAFRAFWTHSEHFGCIQSILDTFRAYIIIQSILDTLRAFWTHSEPFRAIQSHSEPFRAFWTVPIFWLCLKCLFHLFTVFYLHIFAFFVIFAKLMEMNLALLMKLVIMSKGEFV